VINQTDRMITSEVLSADAGIHHAFFTRRGGVSEGLFGSLNCGFGSGDASPKVAHNRGIAMACLGLAGDRLATLRQVHSAAVGPCIGRRSYEVGPEFPQHFVTDDPGNLRFFAPAPASRRFLFDLAGYIAHRLRRAGITTVDVIPHDTVEEEERFFSYRRACLRGERAYGRGLSAIALEE